MTLLIPLRLALKGVDIRFAHRGLYFADNQQSVLNDQVEFDLLWSTKDSAGIVVFNDVDDFDVEESGENTPESIAEGLFGI